MTKADEPADHRPFHEVHASLLENLAAFRRSYRSPAAWSYGRDMATDLEALLCALGLNVAPGTTSEGMEGIRRSVEAGLVAFWAVVSIYWPEAVIDGYELGEHGDAGGDYRPPMVEAVQHWVCAFHPDAQEPNLE